METIKLKILDEAGHTLMTCDADTAVSLVYTNCYKPGDRVALEIDHPGQYCVIQFEVFQYLLQTRHSLKFTCNRNHLLQFFQGNKIHFNHLPAFRQQVSLL